MSQSSRTVFVACAATLLALCIGCSELGPEAPAGPTISSGDGSGTVTAEPVVAPSFSPEAGFLVALTEITLTTATSGSEVRYTTDGTEPGASSSLYDPARKPRLYGDSTWKAIAIKSGRASPMASTDYLATPLFPGFDPSLAVGLRWNYHYKYSHTVAYSLAGDSSYSSESDFSFTLTESRLIDGIAFFRVGTTGSQASRVRWNWIGWADSRLYGSKDGSSKTLLFDSMLGYWIGQGFFSSAQTDGLLSAKAVDDSCVLSQGSQFSDNSTIYVPGYGTIYDPDPYSGFSSTTEKYKAGLGPYSWRYSHGSTTSTEASTDSYAITLTNRESGIDPSSLLFDAEIAEDSVAIVRLGSSGGRIRANISSSSADYLVYLESLGGGDPVLSAYSWKNSMAPIVTGQDLLHGGSEVLYLDSPGGQSSIVVDGLPAGGGDLLVSLMKLTTGATTGAWSASVPLSDAASLDPGSSAQASLGAGKTALFTTAAGFGTGIYLFAIPLKPELDLSLALMKAKTAGATGYSFTSTDFLHFENEHGAGIPEAMYDTKTTTITASAQVAETSALAGDYIFGWGLRP